LQVINELARMTTASGEGEQTGIGYVAASPGVLASGSTAAGDLLLQQAIAGSSGVAASDAEDSQPQRQDAPGEVAGSETEKTSVFDAPATMELDAIVDDLAADSAHAGQNEDGDEDGGDALDQFFASLA
jgi:hypothetical protein